jgi:hypothetical protein
VEKMDTTYEIRNDCLFLKVTGDFDINRSIEIMNETKEKLLIHNLNKFFLDITEETGLDDRKESIKKVYNFSSVISKSFPIGTKISLIETKEQMGGYSFFEDVLTRMGFSVKVTTKPEVGLKWLGVSSKEKS